MYNEGNKSEKLSFWQLLETRSVEIPIIQRDYAQGRKGKEKLRKDFLDALKMALEGNPIELDFIYGSEKDSVLQPLDGQQRLTTLFLLHWFIANKEKRLEDAKERLSKFTYETRTSSREFCNELIQKSVEYKEGRISDEVKDTSWFVASWEKDPTISAMLRMLDDIQIKFKDIPNVWEKLTAEQPISFLYIKLEDFGLSDDLYIKMNSRGKELSPFETFKSRFLKHIEKKEWERWITKPQETFAHKIDTVWTDLFWKYREKIKENDESGKEIINYKIDDKLINFIAGIAINYYAQSLEIEKNEDEEKRVREELEEKGKTKTVTVEAVKRERVERRMTGLFNNPNEILPENFSAKEAFHYLVDCFDKYEQNDYAGLKPNVNMWKHRIGKTIFEDVIKNELTWEGRAIFYAQTVYLLKSEQIVKGSDTSFNDWMRVVRNIVENSTIDSAESFIGAIGLINKLSNGCFDIYKHLKSENTRSNFASEQIKEEIEKAKIILAYPTDLNVKKVLHDIEDTNFCKGKIDFALYCIDYDIDNDPDVSTFDVGKLKKLTTIKELFDKHLAGNDLSNDFRRVFFTIGNNDFYAYWRSWLHVVECPKYCMIENIDNLKNCFTSRKRQKEIDCLGYFKDLILKLSQKDIDKGIECIIDDYKKDTQKYSHLPKWKQRIIEEEGLLDHSEEHYIAVREDNTICWLIPHSKVANDKKGMERLKPIE